MTKPLAFLLIGVPGSGKSTWIKNRKWPADTVFISTDDYIEGYAAAHGLTYDDVFANVYANAAADQLSEVRRAVADKKTIVWDQTNTTVKSRKSKLQLLRGYSVVAVVFPTPDPDELKRRLASRPNKTIPPHIMKSMVASFTPPSYDEGFSEIVEL